MSSLQEVEKNWREGNFCMRGAILEGCDRSRYPVNSGMDVEHLAISFIDSSVEIFNRRTFKREKVI